MCPTCYKLHLRIEELEDEVEELKQSQAKTTDLLVSGEALRDKMKLHAILNGAYDHLVPKKAE